MASGADDVLASAHVVPTLGDALSGVHWSIALTARTREYGPPRLSPRAAATQACAQVGTGDIALVFGNERTGLANEHVEQCSALAHIPANPAYSSLNLAAVQVLAYASCVSRCSSRRAAVGATVGRSRHACAERRDRADVRALENALIALDFLDPRNPKLMPRLRRLFAHGPRTRGGQHPARRREAHPAEIGQARRRRVSGRRTGWRMRRRLGQPPVGRCRVGRRKRRGRSLRVDHPANPVTAGVPPEYPRRRRVNWRARAVVRDSPYNRRTS